MGLVPKDSSELLVYNTTKYFIDAMALGIWVDSLRNGDPWPALLELCEIYVYHEVAQCRLTERGG